MPVVLAIPVAGLIAGAAFGLRWPDLPLPWLASVLVGWTLLAMHAARVRHEVLLALAACGAFAVGGAALSADAWARAWRPPLRLIVEAIAHDQRVASLRQGHAEPEDSGAAIVLSGVLRSDASLTARGAVTLSVAVDSIGRLGVDSGRTEPEVNPVSGGVLLSVLGSFGPGRMEEWRAGRRIRAAADLRRPARYLNPGMPDQERTLARRGVSLVGSVKSAALVTVLSNGSMPSELSARARAYARRALADHVGRWSPRAAAIVSAIVIGDRTGLDGEVERQLQQSGTYHVIAISGGNIALLAGLTLAVFRVAGVLGRSAMLSAAAGLLAYGAIVEGGASVERAVLMACVYFVGRAWDLRGPPFQSLVLAAGLLVIVDPLSVADPASLLTFGATAAIVAIGPAMPRDRLHPLVAAVVGLFAASLVVEAALLPVAAGFFSRVTFAGIVLNFGAIPLMAVAQCAGMAVLPLHVLWPSGAHVAGWLAFAGAEGLIRTAAFVELAPWSTWRVPPPSVTAVVIYYVGLMAVWLGWSYSRTRGPSPTGARTVTDRAPGFNLTGTANVADLAPVTDGASGFGLASSAFVSGLIVTLAAGLWIVAAPWQLLGPPGDGRLHVTFIDVGQGDAALVQFPLGSSMLIDAGGLPGSSSFDIGDRVVAPVLWRAGLRHLDLVALTHGDADHVGGAASVLRDFRPPDAWEGVPVPPHPLLAALHRSSTAQRTRWSTIQRGDQTEFDGVQVIARHPPVPDWERQRVRNDDSLVLELRWREVSFVFTGDIGVEAEQATAQSFEPARLRVLKVPHHGSNTSSSEAFVRALSPDVAVISVGRSNSFGHPARAVVERYRAGGVEVFRTDQDGAVTIATDGTTLRVGGFTGRALELGPGAATREDTTDTNLSGKGRRAAELREESAPR